MPIFSAGPVPTLVPGPDAGPDPLDRCASEPIHVPGSIQPLGALVAFDAADGTVLQASANLADCLPAAARQQPGCTIDQLLGRGGLVQLQQALQLAEGERVRHELIDLAPAPEVGLQRGLEVVVHSHRGVGIAELYPSPPEADAVDGIRLLADAVDTLHAQSGFETLVDALVRRVRALTGFDRVMAYRFDAQWNGQVIADHHAEGMESLLDLHYPASDIPPQARALYHSNLVRLVGDVDQPPVALHPWPGVADAAPLDLSHAQLRSVSPVHLQYLRNMGVRATLTLSLLVEGRLWGLVACHHRGPAMLPNRVRRVLQPLAITAGFMIAWSLQRRQQDEAAAVVQARRTIVEAFFNVTLPLAEVVSGCAVPLAGIVGASGGVLWHVGGWAGFGAWPADFPPELLAALREELVASGREVLHTEHADWPATLAPVLRRQACGLLALSLDPAGRCGIVWLRPEQRRETAWGGDPDRPVQVERGDDGQLRLSPRSSFARWVQLTEGCSRPWREVDVAAARSLATLQQLLAVRAEVDELARSDRRLRGLMALKSDVLWRADAAGRLVAFEGRLPFDPGEAIGRTLPQLLAPWCTEASLGALDAALALRQPFRALWLAPRPRRDGPAHPLGVSGTLEAGEGGAPAVWHGSLTDLGDERRELEAQRREEVARLAEAARSDFLKHIGHELRTPLHALRGYSHLLLKGEALEAASRRRLERIKEASDWMLEMVNDLLDMARLQAVGADVVSAAVDVRAVLTEVVEDLRPLASSRAVALVVEAAPAAAVADPVRLKRALRSLASNAIKYNLPGGEARFVLTDLPAAGRVRVDVHDRGEGLTTEQIGHLFEPFNRLGREGLAIEGTGLGLTIARQLVEAMDGRLYVTSRPGVGSCFSVELARAAP